MVSADWQELIRKKRAARDALIPDEWQLPDAILSKVSPQSPLSAFDLLRESALLSEEEIDITERYDATSLVRMMAVGELSSYNVTLAFCKRAALAQQLTNPLTEIFFDKALERAKWLDNYLAEQGKPFGPLHGLPISLKDMIHVKDEFATMGFVSCLKAPAADRNSVIVDVLYSAGAVFYCKTNVPQTLFVLESYNNVFGRTLNPHKLCLTPGGSTSGEAALISLRGSIMGIGSDIAGSIRAPALCTGIFGFKPTANRLPWAKQQKLVQKGWISVLPTLGPLAQSARDLTLVTKTVIQSQPWLHDSTALAVPWQDVPQKTKLTIGVWRNDADFPVLPPVARILDSAVKKLESKGHIIKMLDTAPSGMVAAMIVARSFSLDTEHVPQALLAAADEEPIPELAALNPNTYLDAGHVADLAEASRVSADLEDYREEWAQVWRDGSLDVLLCPGSRATAVPHGQFGLPFYTMLWNLLDFPASVVPFGKADKLVDSVDGYDASVVDGAPGSVQIVGWRFQDEKTLMATEIIAEALGVGQ